MSEDHIKKATDPQTSEIKTHLSKVLEAQQKNQAVTTAAQEPARELTDENAKRVADIHAQIAKARYDARLAALEARVEVALAKQ